MHSLFRDLCKYNKKHKAKTYACFIFFHNENKLFLYETIIKDYIPQKQS